MGYVYLICDSKNDYYKIGVTTGKIENRIKQLQTGNGTELFVRDYFKTEYPFKLEKILHSKFITKKVLNEWFKLSIEDVCGFKNTCEELQHTVEVLLNNPFFNKR